MKDYEVINKQIFLTLLLITKIHVFNRHWTKPIIKIITHCLSFQIFHKD